MSKLDWWIDEGYRPGKAIAGIDIAGIQHRRAWEQQPRNIHRRWHTRGGTQTHNLLLRREAPYPLGHTSRQLLGNGRETWLRRPKAREANGCVDDGCGSMPEGWLWKHGGKMAVQACLKETLASGYIAQWLERLTADQQVPGSNPGVPSWTMCT